MYKYCATCSKRILGDEPLETGPIVAELQLLVQRRIHLGGHRYDTIVDVQPGRGGPVGGVQRFLAPVGPRSRNALPRNGRYLGKDETGKCVVRIKSRIVSWPAAERRMPRTRSRSLNRSSRNRHPLAARSVLKSA